MVSFFLLKPNLMKKLFIIAISSLATHISIGQQSIFPGVSVSNATQAGFVGIGTKSTTTSTNTPLPNFNLHLHGTADWLVPDRNGILAPTNFGKTTRMGFTNTTTGMLNTDGTEFRMSGNDFSIENRENGNLRIAVPNISMQFSNASKRIFVGVLNNQTSPTYANFNLAPGNLENGLYIHNTGAGTYGVSVRNCCQYK